MVSLHPTSGRSRSGAAPDPASRHRGFDFVAFRKAFETADIERWLAFYAPHAEWIEYRHTMPPRSPHVMRGRREIEHFLHGVAAAPVTMVISNEVIDDRRAAFMLTIRFRDGRRVIENIILEHRDGKVVRQIDVEAWD